MRLATWRWRTRAVVSTDRSIVLGGCPRSGSTLIRRLLDAHPGIACGPESELLLPGMPSFARIQADFGIDAGTSARWYSESGSQTRFVESIFDAYLDLRGKPRWADKTPLNVAHLDWVFAHFPDARFVHVIRDGRDAVASLRDHPIRRLVDGQWVRIPYSRPMEVCIRAWEGLTRRGMRHRGDPRYHEVRYEALVEAPEPTLRELFGFLEEPWDPRVLERTERPAVEGAELDSTAAISDARIGRWRADLSPDEQALFKRLANPVLVELGYAVDDHW